jgi:PKD repeat protein
VIFGEGDWTQNPVRYLELQAWMPGEAPLSANFSANPTSGVVPCTVQFTDLSSGNPATSTDSCPTHTYDDTGCFDVKLVVSNQTDTDSIIREDYIQVFLNQITPEDFIADFESGNIANVQQIGFDSLTFEIRLDDQHGDTYGWYYFAIVGNSGRTVTLFLSNPDGWQNQTCNPLFSNDNRHWERVAEVWRQGSMIGFRQHLGADTVWFAQDFPFTLTQMYAYLDTQESSPHVQRETLGYSVHDRPIDMVTITDPDWPDERKKTVWLISRQHPMESPPTFLLRGFLDWVLEDPEFSRYWQKDITLKVVPIVNVDGVAEGYSRHNVNGINLNRNWQEDMQAEQPEVRAVHQAIDDYLTSGNAIDFFMDLHAAPDNYDFGFRMSLGYTDSNYFQNQETFLYLLETYDPWQDRSRWREMDTSYAFDVSVVTLYDMYGLDTYSSENPWTRREDNSFITTETLLDQGPAWAKAIYNYLYPLTVYDTSDQRIDFLIPGESFVPRVWDFDQRDEDSLFISAYCHQSSDSELVVLYREDDTGLFSPSAPVPTDESSGSPGDGIVSLLVGGELVVTYTDPDMPSRACNRTLEVDSAGSYVPGDANGDGSIDLADAVYLVNYLFIGGPAPDPLDAGDANCDGEVDIADAVYLVNYLFIGGPPPDC